MKPFGQKWAAITILSSLSTSVASVCAAQTAAGTLEASAGTGGAETSAEASAEAAPAPEAEPVPPEPPPAPEPPPPPVEAAPPPPPPPPLVRPYGLIKPTLIFEGRPVESFSQPNASAATAAANPVIQAGALSHESSYTLQVAQSRFGVWFAEGQPVRGQLELDFIDFAKSSPTVQALPRLRIAKVEWSVSDAAVLMVGQDWDLWGPINPHGINLVGGSFQAGNTGFMRQQAKLIWHNDSLELGGALGLVGVNAAAKSAMPEFNGLPSLAGRAAVLLGTAGRIGVDVLATQWRFAAGAPTEKKGFAGGVGLYGDVTPAERFNLRFEGYYGQNIANMGALGLGVGHMVPSMTGGPADKLASMKEVGGFLSAKYGFSDTNGLYGVFGMAKVLNDSDVIPSYGPAATLDATGMPVIANALVPANGPGIKQNMNVRLGYEYRYDKSLAFLLEGFMFKTKHALDATATVSADRSALGFETGLLFTL